MRFNFINKKKIPFQKNSVAIRKLITNRSNQFLSLHKSFAEFCERFLRFDIIRLFLYDSNCFMGKMSHFESTQTLGYYILYSKLTATFVSLLNL